jgi:hypothetical protein
MICEVESAGFVDRIFQGNDTIIDTDRRPGAVLQ